MKALRVLIIEDEALIALLFADVLTEIGHEVCASERTETGAVAAAVAYKPQLIISDVRLQNGSGIDAVRSIMTGGFIPHVFVSGDRLDKKHFNPAAILLQKPFNELQLIEAVERAIDPANVLVGQNHSETVRQP